MICPHSEFPVWDPMSWKNKFRRRNPVSKPLYLGLEKGGRAKKTRKKLRIRSAGWP